MNFNELMQRMRELDTTDAPVTEMPVPMPQAPMTAPEGKDKARMNVNISALSAMNLRNKQLKNN